MQEETFLDADSVARRAAQVIAEIGRRAIDDRGRFLLALSGGSTPRRMMPLLAREDLAWAHVHLFQVDERVAPDESPDRNLTYLKETLLAHLPATPAGIWTMPVCDEDLERVTENYAAVLRSVAGDPPVLDLIHLGLGEDGHTASLVPGDDALDVEDADVAMTAPYKGRRRMTLTYPILNRARSLLWIVTGASKGPALAALRAGDRSLPSGRVNDSSALILADEAAYNASCGL